MKNYKIAVAGTGYVGLSLGVLFAQHHQVVAVDIVQAKVDMINNKKSPIQDDYMDKIMLGAMTTMSEVGVYENAEKINSLTSGIITALGTVMLPRMTNLAANGKKNESKKYINISIQFVSLLAAAIASCA